MDAPAADPPSARRSRRRSEQVAPQQPSPSARRKSPERLVDSDKEDDDIMQDIDDGLGMPADSPSDSVTAAAAAPVPAPSPPSLSALSLRARPPPSLSSDPSIIGAASASTRPSAISNDGSASGQRAEPSGSSSRDLLSSPPLPSVSTSSVVSLVSDLTLDVPTQLLETNGPDSSSAGVSDSNSPAISLSDESTPSPSSPPFAHPTAPASVSSCPATTATARVYALKPHASQPSLRSTSPPSTASGSSRAVRPLKKFRSSSESKVLPFTSLSTFICVEIPVYEGPQPARPQSEQPRLSKIDKGKGRAIAHRSEEPAGSSVWHQPKDKEKRRSMPSQRVKDTASDALGSSPAPPPSSRSSRSRGDLEAEEGEDQEKLDKAARKKRRRERKELKGVAEEQEGTDSLPASSSRKRKSRRSHPERPSSSKPFPSLAADFRPSTSSDAESVGSSSTIVATRRRGSPSKSPRLSSSMLPPPSIPSLEDADIPEDEGPYPEVHEMVYINLAPGIFQSAVRIGPSLFKSDADGLLLDSRPILIYPGTLSSPFSTIRFVSPDGQPSGDGGGGIKGLKPFKRGAFEDRNKIKAARTGLKVKLVLGPKRKTPAASPMDEDGLSPMPPPQQIKLKSGRSVKQHARDEDGSTPVLSSDSEREETSYSDGVRRKRSTAGQMVRREFVVDAFVADAATAPLDRAFEIRGPNDDFKKPSTVGVNCHQCRRNTAYPKAECSYCDNKYCESCLTKRYGTSTDVLLLKQFHCPKCRGFCNCSICLVKYGYRGRRDAFKGIKIGQKLASVVAKSGTPVVVYLDTLVMRTGGLDAWRALSGKGGADMQEMLDGTIELPPWEPQGGTAALAAFVMPSMASTSSGSRRMSIDSAASAPSRPQRPRTSLGGAGTGTVEDDDSIGARRASRARAVAADLGAVSGGGLRLRRASGGEEEGMDVVVLDEVEKAVDSDGETIASYHSDADDDDLLPKIYKEPTLVADQISAPKPDADEAILALEVEASISLGHLAPLPSLSVISDGHAPLDTLSTVPSPSLASGDPFGKALSTEPERVADQFFDDYIGLLPEDVPASPSAPSSITRLHFMPASHPSPRRAPATQPAPASSQFLSPAHPSAATLLSHSASTDHDPSSASAWPLSSPQPSPSHALPYVQSPRSFPTSSSGTFLHMDIDGPPEFENFLSVDHPWGLVEKA